MEINVSAPTGQMLDFVRKKLSESKGRLPQISKECEIPYSTLVKIHQGSTSNPRIRTIQKIADFFHAETVERNRFCKTTQM